MDYDNDAIEFAEVSNLPELEELEDWALENPGQDIRNRPLVTASGQTIGIIDDMLVDRSAERVAAVRLEDGRVCAAEQLEIHADRVIYQPEYEIGATAAATTDYAATDVTADADDSIQIVEEEVAIGKRAVVGDTIRVSSKVVTDVVSEDVTLVNEEAYVETTPVERVIPAAEADALFAEKTIEVTEVHEEPVVAKRAVVTGEVEVGKVAETVTETVSETARRTVVDVDTDLDTTAEASFGTTPKADID